MPSMMTHAVVGVGAAVLTRFTRPSRALWSLSAALAMLPDLDVLIEGAGVPHGSMWAHRGITHSVGAAIVTGTVVATLYGRRVSVPRRALALYCSLVMASHGVLDAFTDGGRAVAFFAPFSPRRYLFPFRPIPAAPIGLAYFSERGLQAFEAELLWIWAPIALVVGAVALLRTHARRPNGP